MDRIIERPRYFSRIQPFIDKPLVKVLTGVRRCGKSTILQQLQEVIRAGSADPQVFAKLSCNAGYKRARTTDEPGLRAHSAVLRSARRNRALDR